MTFMTEKPLTHPFWFFLQRIFNSFVYTEKISNGESEVQQVSPKIPTSTGTVSSGNSSCLDLWLLSNLSGIEHKWGWAACADDAFENFAFPSAWFGAALWEQKSPGEVAPINCQAFMLEVSLFQFQIQSKPIHIIMMWKWCFVEITGVVERCL